jgi:hypothetical protein
MHFAVTANVETFAMQFTRENIQFAHTFLSGHNFVIPARFQLGFLPLERGQPALSVKPTACQPA